MSIKSGYFIDFFSQLPWGRIIGDLWELGKQKLEKLRGQGMYEVLAYESILEIHDARGQYATFHKRQKVRYLQDHIIAYQDQAWGDGQILQDYRCSPGEPVDQYRAGPKTQILISLREVKYRGDLSEFHIRWGIKNGFKREQEEWETGIDHPTHKLKIQVRFPKERPPLSLEVVARNRQWRQALGPDACVQMPDGAWVVTWEYQKPRLHETYALRWQW